MVKPSRNILRGLWDRVGRWLLGSRWHHVEVFYDGSTTGTVRVYLDGEELRDTGNHLTHDSKRTSVWGKW